jgi:hypothetical protein
MKKVILASLILGAFIVSCGPSQEELDRQKAIQDSLQLDSIAKVEAAAAAEAAAQAAADSAAAAEAVAKAAADSAAAAAAAAPAKK